MDSAWVLMGDFNYVLNRDERIGSMVREGEMLPFRRCVTSCGLEDMKSTGCFYTWNNKQFAENNVYCKLDRVLCNERWCANFPEADANWFMPEGTFDHTPMILNVLAERKGQNTIQVLQNVESCTRYQSQNPGMLGQQSSRYSHVQCDLEIEECEEGFEKAKQRWI